MSSTLHGLEHVFFVSCPRLDATDGNASSCHITLLIVINNSWREERGNQDPDECLEPRAKLNHSMQLFGEQLSEKVHATIPKGIVGGFQFTVLQRNLKEWHKRPRNVICLRVLKENNQSRFHSYSVRNSVLIISQITFRDCRLHIFSDHISQNSCNNKKS